MNLPHKTLERKLLISGYRQIIAVDEVGMGSLAGPVVVCAVRLDKKFFQKPHKKLRWLRDSKLLSVRKREEFAANLFQTPHLKYRISFCYPKTIDRMNIYQAARLAMRRAVDKLVSSDQFLVSRKSRKLEPKNYKLKTIILVDGPRKIPGLSLDQIPIIKGDRKVFAIACASIIAKVTRDKMMVRCAKRFPGYGFEKHKGYGTKYHRVQLTLLGSSPIHRQSFRPVAEKVFLKYKKQTTHI